ncbi:phage major capsid protein [Bacillus cereus]|uniref:phage major capsid protein n=1 Tax=Bacillus cereus TaxID=1396 RepID=UPI0018F4DE67|nr:phage major capsid protein [Bacillus cereus]MBJ7966435.1 phage major capsid protein [Bacillus cereus]MBJ7999845.1 phage major capsid protein [Bacillus cereus]
MTIKNLDRPVIENKDQQINNVKEALETGDAQAVAARIVANMENNMQHFQDMMNDVINEAQQAKNENWDAQVLASRGVRVLTNEEKKFYNAAIEVKSFSETHQLMPPTVFERVFEDLEKEHPLLSLVNFQTVGAKTQWVVRKEGTTTAFWGDVCDSIREMIDEGFETIEEGMYKLSGFLVVCKAMFELGPEWLDKYVRAFMKEVVAEELEKVIVMGTGKKQPIGMIKDLKGSVTDGIYPDKKKVVLEDFTPVTIGKKILAPTTKGGTKRYTGVTLIVNPLDYATKFFPIGAKRKDDGTWTYDNFGVPGLTMVQSPAVPLNTMISGKPKDYFMGVALEQRLESDDTIRLIEDQRLYLVRQLANGRPLDPDSFTVFDITALEAKEGTTTP